MEQSKVWQADWIFLDNQYFPQWRKNPGLPPVEFQKEFTVEGEVQSAVYYGSAMGVYKACLNENRVGSARLSPGWTDYHKRIQYQRYDVTALIRQGRNRVHITVGDGWYVGNIAVTGRNQYGRYPLKLICELEITYTDGRRDVICTDESWQTAPGGIQYSDLQSGECYDATREEVEQWFEVSRYDFGTRCLVPQQGPELTVKEELKPVSMTQRENSVVIDMGQNMVGVVRVSWRGGHGTRAALIHGEMLRPDGSVYTENLRTAEQTDTYFFKGGDWEQFEPEFTIHGFRYVEAVNMRREDIRDVTGMVIYADVPRVGEFECSNPKVNQLYRNILWGQKGNFNSVPTDCPQRDERMGWTGDAQIFAKTACYNMDCHAYFRKYVTDIMDAQLANGTFTDVAPLVRRQEGMGLVGIAHAAWGDAGIIIPWTLYRFYGDKEVLLKYYGQMEKHMNYMLGQSDNYIRDDEGYGDWLSVGADTPKAVMATAFMAYCAQIMSKIANVLDRKEKIVYYKNMYHRIKAAFQARFMDESCHISGDTQACYAMALKFGLVEEADRGTAAGHLKRLLAENGYKLSTGFVGVSYLLPVLCDNGETELAYRLLLQEEYPSWLYSVNNGATTVWERWNSYTYENGFADIAMNSFNHYSLGSVGEWLYEYVGGITQREDSAGFTHLVVRPCICPLLDWARVRYQAPCGEVRVYWKTGCGKTELEVSLPKPGDVVLPDGTEIRKPAGTHYFEFTQP